MAKTKTPAAGTDQTAQQTAGTPDAPAGDPAAAPAAQVRVSSRPESFYRCGRLFTREPVYIDLAELRDGELERLLGEPQLDALVVDGANSGANPDGAA